MKNNSPKDYLREESLKKRDEIPPEVRRVKNRLIKEMLFSLDEFRNANTILLFASFRSEPDTIEIIKASLGTAKRIVLPKVDREKHMLDLYEIKNIDELSPGFLGIPEPDVNFEERMVTINDMDIIIIPGAGYDISGNRIGYGKGYYDRLLSGLKKNIIVIALAFEEQITVLVPAEQHDVKVNMIVTDRQVIKC
jgi:5-formyltetrahydrofolate cyclo-ligase